MAHEFVLNKYVGTLQEFYKTFKVNSIKEFKEKYVGEYTILNENFKNIRLKNSLKSVYNKLTKTEVKIKYTQHFKYYMVELIEKHRIAMFKLSSKFDNLFLYYHRNIGELVALEYAHKGYYSKIEYKLNEMGEITLTPYFIFKPTIEEMIDYLTPKDII